jgi:hypothetical protein
VEIQEPTLRALVLHYSWDLAPRFPDVRGAVTDIFRAATGSPEDWTWDTGSRPMVAAWSGERRLHMMMMGTGMDVVSERPEDPLPSVRTVLPACLHALNLVKPDECSAAAMWLLPAPTIEDASAGIESTFGAGNLRHILEPLGGRPSALELTAEFQDKDGRATFRAKPASAEELVDAGEYFLSDIESTELPPAAIVARIHRVRNAPDGIDSIFDVSAQLLTSVQQAGDKLLARLVTA